MLDQELISIHFRHDEIPCALLQIKLHADITNVQ